MMKVRAGGASFPAPARWFKSNSELPAHAEIGAPAIFLYLAETVGLTGLAAQHGITLAQARRCLADQAALDRLGKMSEAASAQGVGGTPTFFLNGANIGTQSWATLEPILRESAG
jgi:2-hydroxychromene-2-carboxylate isomerase